MGRKGKHGRHGRDLAEIQRRHPNVTQIAEARKAVQFFVDSTEREAGVPRDPGKCPAAMAIRRMTGADAVYVRTRSTIIVRGDAAYRYSNPRPLAAAVISEDYKRAFPQNAVYTINAPAASERLTSKREYSRRHSRKNAKKVGVPKRVVMSVRDSWTEPGTREPIATPA